MAKASTAAPAEKKTRAPRKAAKAPLTTRENLSALIGTARKILRKDKGLNGDADRLPLLTWVMFLKFLDDLEIVHEEESELDGKAYEPIIEAPYRWRDWAAREDGISGDELLAFIGQEQTRRADGSAGPGLFAYLRSLASRGAKGSQREVIANVFKGVQNRMVSGYLLRDILNKINGIHFSASEEIHTLSHLYESMLREMRDAAGDSGEFYTPRPVVRFMVQAMDPQLGETVLDPACGTGGFLVEAYDHLAEQVKNPDQRRTLQRSSLYGQEAKPLPYMLAQMNLLLHGLEAPQIAYGNTLERRINEIGHSERVDVILTNPPFGGEEEAGIKNNFPPNMQTAETALLFLQYIMRKLRVAGAPVAGGKAAARGGRAAVVVPNGTLFGDGICAVIKQEMLKEFRLHTIVKLPQGVFAPYTDIPANLLFFERGGPTDSIWYYELPLPEGRKKYSKTAPLQFEEFAAVQAWWNAREEGPQAWKVDFAARRAAALDAAGPHWQRAEEARAAAMAQAKTVRELEQDMAAEVDSARKAKLQDKQRAAKVEQQAQEQAAKAAQSEGDALYWPIYNLDLKNPRSKVGLVHADPKKLIASMRAHEAEVMRLLCEIDALIGNEASK
jgi:type I restriction enzyme M protein